MIMCFISMKHHSALLQRCSTGELSAGILFIEKPARHQTLLSRILSGKNRFEPQCQETYLRACASSEEAIKLSRKGSEETV